MKNSYLFIVIIFFIACSNSTDSDDEPTSRDPWLQPFTSESIWNMPIGSEAVYKDADLREAANVGVDIQHILISRDSDPNQQILGSPGFGPGRCSGTTELGFSIQVPDSWIVPDAGNSPYGLTPNSNFAILMPDGETVFEGVQISRCEAGGAVYLPTFYQFPNNRSMESIRSNGLVNQGQGASAMSALGGTIRLGEFISDEPIRHVIKINPWGDVDLHYSEAVPGWKWPARSADNYAPQNYNRNADPDIVMGSLLAIPPEVTPEDLGITTEPGQKLFFTLQNYGTYFTEDAAWDTWDIIVERDVEIEFEQAFGFSMDSNEWRVELNKLMGALHVITNNSPTSVSGGGTPIQPLLPPLTN